MDNQQNPGSSGSPPTILVVDDDLPASKLCKTLLEKSGYRVLEAEGSSEALKICTQHDGPIDLLVTDLVLPPPGFQLAVTDNQFPHVNGHQLAVRAATIRKGLRIILMSANLDKELANHGIKRNTLPFLAKPFKKEDLVNLVQDVLTQQAPSVDGFGQDKPASDTEWFG